MMPVPGTEAHSSSACGAGGFLLSHPEAGSIPAAGYTERCSGSVVGAVETQIGYTAAQMQRRTAQTRAR
jgi:hypothetical protein